MEDQPWFQDGLRFECTQCGDCCTGAPGYVWVNRQEMEDLAAELGLELEAFEKKYVRRVGIRKSLIEYANGDCVFFDPKARKCTVYNARPEAMPHLAVLAIERRLARGLEADVRGLPRKWPRQAAFGRKGAAPDLGGQSRDGRSANSEDGLSPPQSGQPPRDR